MIGISFEINGRKLNPNSVAHAFERAVLEGVTTSIKDRVGSLISRSKFLAAALLDTWFIAEHYV
jgi:hypothetical protein